MLIRQQSLPLSQFANFYDIVVPQDHILRKWDELVDFGFVIEELEDKYCPDNGRPGDAIRLFKYLMLKAHYNESDKDIVERSQTDMACKMFLGYAPEDQVIDSSSLSKFRKLRLKDEDMMERLIKKSVDIAVENGVLKSRTILVDSTHTASRYNKVSPCQNILDTAKRARKALYQFDEGAKERMPAKISSEKIEDVLEYAQKVAEAIEQKAASQFPAVKKSLNLLKELVEDDLEHLQNVQSPNDEEARTGHKTANSSYFGYKTHLAMTLERLIVAATVTSGEKHDGKELPELIRQATANGVCVKAVVGDMAYSEKENIRFSEQNGIMLVSRLSKTLEHSNYKNGDKFEYNKDAGRYVCQAGHMSIKKTTRVVNKEKCDDQRFVETYFFSVDKCKVCPFREGCYREGAKIKTFSVSTKPLIHAKHLEFQETKLFKNLARLRYMIEAKNSELKNGYGLDRAQTAGLLSMKIQDGASIFTANVNRIIRLMENK